MAVATLAKRAVRVDSAASEDVDALRRLQRDLLQQASAAETKADLLHGLADVLERHAHPVAMFLFQRNAQGELADAVRVRPAQEDSRSQRLAKQLISACQAACRTGEIGVWNQASPAATILAAPIPLRGGDPEALGVIFPADRPTSHVLMLVQMVASHIVLWHVIAGSHDDQADAHDTAALIELLDHVTAAPDLRQACYALVGELASFLNCHRVAVGLRSGGKGRCRLLAVSGVARFDHRSPTTHAIEAAMDEAVLRQGVTVWPASEDQQRHAALAHKNLCSVADTTAVVSTPLRDIHDHVIGALTVLDNAGPAVAKSERFLRAAERSLATSLAKAQRSEGGPVTRLARAVGSAWRTWKGKVALAAVGLLLAAMIIPLPYKVPCACQIEPVTRRFVAAPFEGTLESSLVEPGDIVRQGNVLARMDGREVRWKRASVVADQKQAIKRRDAAQASHSYADQQIAQLEIERLALELQLLDHRAENLEIKSPVAGIVVSGDLERVEGAPLKIGQTLFEIAPLESMIVEVAVPDNEISHVAGGQTVDVRLDAYPDETWQAIAAKIQPRSRIRDEENVFIAEAELDNTDGRLRPGMKGRAKLATQKRPLGWILFHKPWEYVAKKLSW